jgi:lysozyme family protein
MEKGMTPFDTALAFTLAEEGGFSDREDDPGGATNKGITLATFSEYQPGATVDELRAISDADVWRIYRLGYWNKMRCGDLPAGVGLSVFDFGVNAGVGNSARMLQWASGLSGDDVDGIVGPHTIAAANRRAPAILIDTLAAMQAAHYRRLPDFPTFGAGWLARTVRRLTAALAEVSEPAPGHVDE